LKSKDLLSVAQLSAAEVWHLLSSSQNMKRGRRKPKLPGKVLALLFEKPSLRTRVSFDVAMYQLGGHTIYLSQAEVGLGKRESVSDVAKVLSRYVDIIAARTFAHETVELLAQYTTVPVINALSDLEHPCQALADLLTIKEKKGKLEGVNVAYVGDGNNVAHSLLLACSLVGANVSLATPSGYQPKEAILSQARLFAAQSGSEVICTQEPRSAVAGADVVYTDVWTSMGQEAEAARRRTDFAGYQINAELMALAKKDAIFMHPLPAHPGEEVAHGLMESPQSVVYDQAENRLHLQKALLAELLGMELGLRHEQTHSGHSGQAQRGQVHPV